jgi:6-phosphogluconolactonase
MNNSCRLLVVQILLVAPLVPLALLSGRGGPKPSAHQEYIAFVGNYTTKTESRGIYKFRFDTVTGKMSALELAIETKDPSWVVVHPNGKYLYAANEMGKGSTVSAFAIEPKTGKLAFLNELPALGLDPCHLSFDATGKFLFSANYTSGSVVVYPILSDGRLGEHTAILEDQGKTGPNSKRQDRSHAHWIGRSDNNQLVYVADLGLDQVLIYEFDSAKGTLHAIEPGRQNASAEFKPGTGPRHVAFSRNRKFMYVLGELESTVTVFESKGPRNFTSIQNIPMLPPGFSGRNDAAEIELHPTGKFLYASNRGHDSIAVYAVDGKTGKLTEVEDVSTGGKEPRHFAIDPSGNFLLAENQNSNSIVEFRIDPSSGKLTPTGETLSTPSPICLAFRRAD